MPLSILFAGAVSSLGGHKEFFMHDPLRAEQGRVFYSKWDVTFFSVRFMLYSDDLILRRLLTRVRR